MSRDQSAAADLPVSSTVLSFGEFVALIAMLLTITALAVDLMLPALPDIASSLHIVSKNNQQFIIGAYLLGVGCALIFYGPLADHFGRRRLILYGLAAFVAATLLAGSSRSFEFLIAARFIQGAAAASMRTLAIAIVRDCYSGRRMARVMSLSVSIVLLVPILAPGLGQILLTVLPWRGLFVLLSAFSAIIGLWAVLRLPETLAATNRTPLTFGRVSSVVKLIVTNRYSLGYTLCGSILYGALLGFIFSVQQIFQIVFHRADLLALAYGVIGAVMAVGTFSNSRLVERYGTHRLSHGALVALVAIAALHCLFAVSGWETAVSLILFQSLQMFCFGLCASNFNAMAMQPMGHVAGTAASTQSAISTVGGVFVGSVIGQNFNGTTVPIAVGFLVVALATLGIAFIVERGRLFVSPATGRE